MDNNTNIHYFYSFMHNIDLYTGIILYFRLYIQTFIDTIFAIVVYFFNYLWYDNHEYIFSRYFKLKTLPIIKKIITHGCVLNTVLLIVMYSAGMLINENFIPTIDRVFSLLFFSLALAGANIFLFSRKLNFPLRLLVHYLFTAAIFYVAFILWGGYNGKASGVLIILVLFTLLYGICVGITAAIRSIFKVSGNTKKEYKKVYDKKEDDYKPLFGGKNNTYDN